MASKLVWLFCVMVGLVPLETLAAQGDKTLCSIEQTVYFSCKTHNKKIISVCGMNEKDVAARYLNYSYGSEQKIDFSFPERKKDSLPEFKLHSDGGPKWSENILSFSSNEYRYYVFTISSAFDANEAGVDVFKGKTRVAHILCAKSYPDVGKLASLAELGIQEAEDGIPKSERQ